MWPFPARSDSCRVFLVPPAALLRAGGVVAAVAATTYAAALLQARFPVFQFLFLYIPLLAAVAYLEGLAVGLFGGVLVVLAAWNVATPPGHSVVILADALPMGIFALTGLAVIIGSSRLRDFQRTLQSVSRTQRFLADATAALAEDLDVRLRLSTMARLVVPTLADWCAVDMVEEDGVIRTLVTAHRDPGKVELARLLQERYPADPQASWGPANVIRTGRPELYPEIPDHLLVEAAYDAEHLKILRALGLCSAMGVPMIAQNRTLGAITFFSAESCRRYGGADLVVATELARRAALAIDNAQLHHAEQSARHAAERVAERNARLQTVTAALAEAITPEQVADAIITQGIPTLGVEAGLISLLTEDGNGLETMCAIGFPEELLKRGRVLPVSAPTPATEVVRTRMPLFLKSRDAIASRYPQLQALQIALRPGAWVVLPLLIGQRPIGVLVFVFPEPREFPPDDRAFLLALAGQCAQALERAQLYALQRKVAETLQQAFLPRVLPELPGIKLNAGYRSGTAEAEIGGDWYDVFRLPDARVALSVGDVVGHGLQAALIMGQVRQTIRAAALAGHSPSMVLDQASKVLRLTYELEGLATAVFGILDPERLTFTYATAGHPGPVLGTPQQGVEALACGGGPLGLPSAPRPPEWTVALPQGSLLALYTDGLLESTRNVLEGEAVLAAAIRAELDAPAADPAEALLQRVLADRLPPDDVAVVTVWLAQSLDRFDVSARATPAAVRFVRQTLRRLLSEAGAGAGRTLELEVAVGEAMNNVIEHAYHAASGMVHVRARRDGDALVVDVADEGRWREPRGEGRGRGLPIMQGLADQIEVDRTPSGTTVRLTFALAAAADAVGGVDSAEAKPAAVSD